MNMVRVMWGMSAFVWAALTAMCCVMWGSWVVITAVIFLLLPEFPWIGGSAGSGRMKPERTKLYNTIHVATWPIAVLVIGVIAFFITGGYNGGFWPVAIAGAAWFVNIALNRALGFGLRDEDGNIVPVGFELG